MSEKRTFGWMHPWRAPKAAFNGATLEKLTPRGEWLYQRSRLRGMDNPNVTGFAPFKGEIGTYYGFSFITTIPHGDKSE